MFEPVHRSGLWLLLGAFAFLGLFAMHGLGAHGVSHGGGSEGHLGTGVQASPHEAGSSSTSHQVDVMTSHRCDGSCADGASTASSLEGTGSDGGSSLTMALCLAVLVAVATMAILAAGRLRQAVLGPPAPLDRAAAVLRSALGHDPPTIFNLSIQRC